MKKSLKTITIHGLMLALIAISTGACSKTGKVETHTSDVSADAKPAETPATTDDSQEGSEKAKAKKDVAQVKAETDSGVDVTLPEKPDDIGINTNNVTEEIIVSNKSTDNALNVTLPQKPTINDVPLVDFEENNNTEELSKYAENLDPEVSEISNPEALSQIHSEIIENYNLPENTVIDEKMMSELER